MDILGIGPLELIVILVIAFIVVGPERLPELARSIGKHVRELRALSQGLTAEWQREIDSLSQTETGESLQETLTKPFKDVQSDLKQTLPKSLDVGKELQETLTEPFREVKTDLEQAVRPSPASQSDAAAEPKAEPALVESSPPEQSDTQSGDANHADT